VATTARAPRPADVILAADRLPPLRERPGAGTLRVLMIGDLIGKPGREALERILPDLRAERHIDLVTANGENLAGGMGLTASTAGAVFAAGVDVITSGNHIWDKREIYAELERDERILRPLNYGLTGVPGRGWGIFHAHDGTEVAVINAQGRTYMQPIESPFAMVDTLLTDGADELPPVRLVDFHCEITSEKTAFGLFLDGRVSAVVGTHTHVPTADERILRRGTAYVSDLGMTGPVHSVIGFEPETVLPRFLNGLPTRFEVGSGPVVFNACLIDIETASGGAVAIARLSRIVDG
jgi:2',3'-cyclic-nucleotide 2'-phosphodiesterase